MKKILLLIFLSTFIFGCSKDKINNNNPYLPNYNFAMEINTNLPTYSNLKFVGNSVKAYPANGPSRGIIIFNTGSGYNAFDGSCPNQTISSCSTLTLSSSNASCPCEKENYNLFTGQCTGKQYPLKVYRVEVTGDVLRISN